MRRVAVCLTFVLALAGLAPAGLADPGHPGPRITRAEFVRFPLKAGTLERLVIVAHDPDSWISEIQVQWEDPDHTGGVIFAHTFFVQDPALEHPGIRARLRLDVQFEHPGPYHVQIRAISEKRCEGGNDVRISKTVEMDVTAADPLEAFADPDDTEGPLDVVGAEQTIVADEAGLGNHVVHTVTMAEDLGPAALGGPTDEVEFSFDTDEDPTTFERRVVVDRGPDGLLHAPVVDAGGAVVGEATVSVDGASLSIDLDAALLGAKVARYGWVVVTNEDSSGSCTSAAPCVDRAPDAGTFLHVL